MREHIDILILQRERHFFRSLLHLAHCSLVKNIDLFRREIMNQCLWLSHTKQDIAISLLLLKETFSKANRHSRKFKPSEDELNVLNKMSKKIYSWIPEVVIASSFANHENMQHLWGLFSVLFGLCTERRDMMMDRRAGFSLSSSGNRYEVYPFVSWFPFNLVL